MSRFTNNVKTALLMGGLMGLFLLVGSLYGQQGMIFGVAFGGLANIIAWFFSDRDAIATMRGQEVPADAGGVPGELYRIVDELRQNGGAADAARVHLPAAGAQCIRDGPLARRWPRWQSPRRAHVSSPWMSCGGSGTSFRTSRTATR